MCADEENKFVMIMGDLKMAKTFDDASGIAACFEFAQTLLELIVKPGERFEAAGRFELAREHFAIVEKRVNFDGAAPANSEL